MDYLLKRIADQANARIFDKGQIQLSPQVLRSTVLRKWIEEKGVQFGQKIVDLASEKYIW